ncbi:class I SAM-dependent methyltransferase [bacterium]|nr:class I SAM-dependent methyltransferase [bacterium]
MPIARRYRLAAGLARLFPALGRWAAARRRFRVFSEIFQTNFWGSPTSVSGPGSELGQTAMIREAIPALLAAHGVGSILDAPCGDFNWMQHVPLTGIHYTGVDIVPALIARNRASYGAADRTFVLGDIVEGALPTADLIFCRDCLVHLSYDETRRALDNFRRSGATWLLTTTFTSTRANHDIVTGDWRPIMLQQAPYGFPEPVALINEGCTEFDGRYPDKSLGLWRLADLPTW